MVNGTQEQRTTGTRKHKPQHQDTMELKTRQKTSTQYDQNKSASSLNTPPIPAQGLVYPRRIHLLISAFNYTISRTTQNLKPSIHRTEPNLPNRIVYKMMNS